MLTLAALAANMITEEANVCCYSGAVVFSPNPYTHTPTNTHIQHLKFASRLDNGTVSHLGQISLPYAAAEQANVRRQTGPAGGDIRL